MMVLWAYLAIIMETNAKQTPMNENYNYKFFLQYK